MKNEISTNKIIGDIKKTIGNRKYCYNLPEHLSDYAGSIVGWLKATTPAKIDALVEHIEELQHQLDRSISAERVWEKTMMEVCGEDGPASVAAVIKQLAAENVALALENVAMKQIVDSVTNLDNEPQYHDEGMGCGLEDRGITDRYEACRHGWDEAMERVYGEVIPCAEELDFPVTDRIVAGIKADGVEMVLEIISYTKGMLYADSVKDTLSEVSSRLREGADK